MSLRGTGDNSGDGLTRQVPAEIFDEPAPRHLIAIRSGANFPMRLSYVNKHLQLLGKEYHNIKLAKHKI